MNQPNGTDLLSALIELLAKQHQVKITYEITKREYIPNEEV